MSISTLPTSTEPTADEVYRHLVEHMGVALVATDAAMLIRTWNAAASRLFGAAAEVMIGTPLVSVLPVDQRSQAQELLRRAIDLGETQELEFHDRDSRGQRRELTGAVAPVVSATGRRIGASVCIRDITRRINLQNELYQNRKMTALGGLAGKIAHHFNNTLGGVITSIDFANASDDIDVKDRILLRTSQSLQRMTNLVNGLLVFAEGDQRADDLADFTELLSELADDLETELKDTGIRFTVNLPQLPVSPVPRAQVMTVLRNLASNAIEAMPSGGSLHIDVALEGGCFNVRVCDTGCGLTDEAMARLFEPFFTTKKTGGLGVEHATGLGLAVAHGIVQTLGGSIEVASTPGQGACFTVKFPKATC